MVEVTLKKEELGATLLPFNYKDFLIFSKKLNSEAGFLGIKNNSLIFISYENLPDDLKIKIPENTQEIQEMVLAIDWVTQLAMVTPDLNAEGSNANKKAIIKELLEFEKNRKINILYAEGYL